MRNSFLLVTGRSRTEVPEGALSLVAPGQAVAATNQTLPGTLLASQPPARGLGNGLKTMDSS